jgi:O-antigen/teichoic acid export membrane protein
MATAPINREVSPCGFPSGSGSHKTLGQSSGGIQERLLQWRAWTTKGAYSVADLGLTSAANFGINVLMARGLPEKEYGAFSVAYAMLLVAMGFQTSYILEPVSVLGPCRSLDTFGPYRDSVFWLNLMMTLVLSGVLAIWAGIAWHGDLGPTLLSCAMSGPFIMGFWFLRRVYYLDSNSSSAAFSSVVYAIVLMLLAVSLRAVHHFSTQSAMIAMGIASLAASVHSYRKYFGGIGWCGRAIAQAAREHWNYGKWPVASSVLSIGSSNMQTFLVAFSSGLGAAGVLRAMQNLVTPAQQIVSALAIFIVPVLSRDIAAGRTVSANRKAAMYIVIVVALTCAYAVSLLCFRGPLESIIYNGKFKEYIWLLPLSGLIPVMIALTSGFSVLLRANQKPQHLLAAAVAGSAVGFASALPLSRMWGVWGAITSVLLANAAIAITTAVFYFAYRRQVVLLQTQNLAAVIPNASQGRF